MWYELYAVTNHMGGLGGGHYVACAKHGDTWYKFDDSHVTEVPPTAVVTRAAYVLYYRRIEGDTPGEVRDRVEAVRAGVRAAEAAQRANQARVASTRAAAAAKRAKQLEEEAAAAPPPPALSPATALDRNLDLPPAPTNDPMMDTRMDDVDEGLEYSAI